MGALLQMNPSRLRRTVHDESHDRAAAAAKAGVDFALAKLAEQPDWRAQGSGRIVDSEQLVVQQDRGNVWGWIRTQGGDWAGFCFRFNYQDGAQGGDGLPQPEQTMPFEAISVNNLEGASPQPLPIGDGPGFSYAGRNGYEVPEHAVSLTVYGMVGPEVGPGKFPSPNKAPATVLRQVEGLYKISGLAAGLPEGAVLQAGADSKFILGASDSNQRGHLRLMADGQKAKMRTKGSSEISQAAGKQAEFNFYPDMDAEVAVGSTFQANTKAGQTFQQSVEQPNEAMLDVEWSKVSQSTQSDRLRLPAGVYAVSDSGGDGRKVKFYPMSFNQYRTTLLQGSSPTESDLPAGFPQPKATTGQAGTRDVLEFTSDVEVEPGQGNNKGIAIIPASGARQQAVSTEWDAAAFNGMTTAQKQQTGEAVLDLLIANNPGGFQLSANGAQFSVDAAGGGLQGGTPADLANALWNSNGNLTWGNPAGGMMAQVVVGVPPQAPPSYLTPQRLVDQLQAQLPPVLAEGGDPLDIPNSVQPDSTQPQDIEVHFAPPSGKSAAIRAEGNVLIGAHLSGKGGAFVAGGRVDLVGLGIDIEANQGEREGISVYAKDVVNISTYDQKRDKYWDASIKGVLFSRKAIRVRLGEQAQTASPEWGVFDLQGVAVSLGEASSNTVDTQLPTTGTGGDGLEFDSSLFSVMSDFTPIGGPGGFVAMIADGIRLTYEPKFLAPYVKAERLVMTFQAVSVVEK